MRDYTLISKKGWESRRERYGHKGYKSEPVPWNKNKTKETDERVARIARSVSKVLKQQYENGRKQWNKGLTKETDRRVLSQAKRVEGHKVSQETINKIRAARANQVIRHSEETKRKIGLALKSHKVSQETRVKISIANKKVFNSKTEEEQERIRNYGRQASLGKTRMERTRKLISISSKKQWEEKRDKMLKSLQTYRGKRPSQFENNFLIFCQKEGYSSIRYVGDGKFWLTVPGEFRHIQNAINPDFIVEPFKETNTVIETTGVFWHSQRDRNTRKQIYKVLGVNCIMITDTQFYNKPEEVKQILGEISSH